MKNMTPKHRKALILSAVIFLTGFAVTAVYMFGFVSEREAALALAQNVMSLSSAICFLLSAVALYYIARVMEGEIAVAQIVLPITSMMTSVFIAVHLVSIVVGTLYTGMRRSLGIESYDILDQIILTHPSLESMINFTMVSIAGVLAMMCAPCRAGTPCSGKKSYFIGKIIIWVSAAAILDRFLNVSYWIGLANKPMGLVSLGMFILLGAGLMTVCRSR